MCWSSDSIGGSVLKKLLATNIGYVCILDKMDNFILGSFAIGCSKTRLTFFGKKWLSF